jgi:hypothetical protein
LKKELKDEFKKYFDISNDLNLKKDALNIDLTGEETKTLKKVTKFSNIVM